MWREHHGLGGPFRRGAGWRWGFSAWGRHAQRPFRFRRRFLSREERINRLEEYLKHLEAEAQGVRERLAQLRRAEQEEA